MVYIYIKSHLITCQDPTGLIARYLNKSDKFNYRRWVRKYHHNYLGKYNSHCADLAMRILIDYAYEKNKNVTFRKRYYLGLGYANYRSIKYKNKNKYWNKVGRKIGAEHLARWNTKRIASFGGTASGGLLIVNKKKFPGKNWETLWDTKTIVYDNIRKNGSFRAIWQNQGLTIMQTRRRKFLLGREPNEFGHRAKLFKVRPRRWNWQYQ